MVEARRPALFEPPLAFFTIESQRSFPTARPSTDSSLRKEQNLLKGQLLPTEQSLALIPDN